MTTSDADQDPSTDCDPPNRIAAGANRSATHPATNPTTGPSTDPATDRAPVQHRYHHPAAGWGAAMSVAKVLVHERAVRTGARAIHKMNHEDGGFDCPGCAWPDDSKGLKLDICENSIRHVTWEMTHKRVGADFFAQHSVSELHTWSDFALEDQGRLTEPMVYDADTDHHKSIAWQDAFDLIGRELRELESPNQAAFRRHPHHRAS